jgi:small-conductance mechanosensitive channel
VLLVVFVVAGRYAGRLVGSLLSRSPRFQTNQRFLAGAITWTVVSAGLLLALGVLGFAGVAASMLATGGVVAIVLGFAFREIGENFLAGFFLSFSRPFEVGDLVETGGLTGTVRAIEWRYVHLRTADACDVFVPSAQLFREPLYNYTKDGLRRGSFVVGVAYDDEPESVLGQLRAAVTAVPGVLEAPAPVFTIRSFAAAYVEYEVFFFVDLSSGGPGMVDTQNAVKAACWHALRASGMTFSTDVKSALEIASIPPLRMSPTDQDGSAERGAAPGSEQGA